MDHARWTEILSRIDPRDAADIDDIAAAFEPRAAVPGRDIFPEVEGCLLPRAGFRREDAVAIGLRVTEEPADVADRAMRVTAFALERDVEVVVLSHVDRSGFERFGFRVERVSGDTEEARAACEDQIRRFWSIDLVL
ncbi:hypothetical protein [Amaricoccus solimangrovi]|uniref:Uncharacterized protein n=1 Tax=Amaricoccus solimangrovi TaxID=2589815 RepID=A0A501WGY9_9RHOB|nr:hypothetical protein [Amaricoccus solimangrovi]TPE48849.1 hypothetical protein FJM51_16705 [Amaricoccus solimangrovi]